MPCLLEKKAAVNWDVCSAIEAAQLTIAQVYLGAKAKAVVTSARDALDKHSTNSAHRTGRAIDLRIINLFPTTQGIRKVWYEGIVLFAQELSRKLDASKIPGAFYVVVERDHLHLEWAPKGVKPNIPDWELGVKVYIKSDVREILNPKAVA